MYMDGPEGTKLNEKNFENFFSIRDMILDLMLLYMHVVLMYATCHAHYLYFYHFSKV